MEKYKRIFVIVLDSLGIGEMPDAARFGDHDVDTFGHICDIVGTLNIPNLKKLGLLNLHPTKEMEEEKHPIAYYTRLKETSNGKDTMTGHWEMMGLHITKPFKTFTETGFPKELIDELEKMGIVGGYNGAKPRKVLMTKQQYEERKMRNLP